MMPIPPLVKERELLMPNVRESGYLLADNIELCDVHLETGCGQDVQRSS